MQILEAIFIQQRCELCSQGNGRMIPPLSCLQYVGGLKNTKINPKPNPDHLTNIND